MRIGGDDEINQAFGFWTTEVKGEYVEQSLQMNLNIKNITNYFTLSLKPKNALGQAQGKSPYHNVYDLIVTEEQTEEGDILESLWIHKKGNPSNTQDAQDEQDDTIIE